MSQEASSESQVMPFQADVHQRAYELFMGMLVARAIQVAVEFRLPDHAVAGPISVPRLAEQLQLDQSVLQLLLRCLSSVGIFAPLGEDTFAQTELSACFRSDLPGSWYGLARMFGSQWSWRAWGGLPYTLKTGLPSFEHQEGKEFWNYMQHNREDFAVFQSAMTSYSEALNPAIVAAIAQTGHLNGVQRVVDIGGGEGGLLTALLRGAPQLQASLFDLPEVIAQAEGYLVHANTRERCDLVAGNFFEHIPAGGDLYLLKHVLHDWDDHDALRILRNVREALVPQGKRGRLLIIEYVVPPAPQPPSPFLFVGLFMRLNTKGGYERTEAEFQKLLEQAGMRLVGIHATGTPDFLVEGCLA
ncbi:MAG: hypothetical protein J2P37_26370 [Ktedonobacteraceae bacterium]|nr:hypothetical protein [Ktedonobacteraceae bacterium]